MTSQEKMMTKPSNIIYACLGNNLAESRICTATDNELGAKQHPLKGLTIENLDIRYRIEQRQNIQEQSMCVQAQHWYDIDMEYSIK